MYSYCSSNYCKALLYLFLTLRDDSKKERTIKRAIKKRSKELILKKKKRKSKTITLKRNKYNIAFAMLEKETIISNFGCTNINFADCTP